MTDNIWLEVDKSNGAIMSYYLHLPTTSSSNFDYIEATQDELTYLDALEDAVFPQGTIATISDLSEHRARVRAAKVNATKTPVKASYKPSPKPQKPAGKTKDTNASASKSNAKERFIAALKQHRSR
ncbi:hypothetical protein [Pseudomonas sp. 18058]|uniref:hypothetical protein n=1 Tax=Pseudomonas sp. 18058 TaxID=2681406 RepID=UPI0013594ADE|nr:hypothetical protein [Pseudomonas sp. 18058]